MKSKTIKKFIVGFIFPLLALITTSACSPPQSNPIHQLYVFGDSLSDAGSVYAVSNGLYPPNPPYFQGRYSNGQVWVEYLADRLQLSQNQTHNFAYGGATTGVITASRNSATDSTPLVPSLLSQVQTATQTNQPSNSSTQATLHANTLAVLWAGANDYLQGSTTPTRVVANILEAIDALVDEGAQRFLVANLPDLGQLPATRNTANSETLSTLSQEHNQLLERSLAELTQQHSQLQIALLRVDRLYQEVITNPEEFGFTNVMNACLSSEGGCENPDRFLFWDGIHPTTAAHRHLADAAFIALQEREMVMADGSILIYPLP